MKRRIAACSTVLLLGLSSTAAARTKAAGDALEARITSEVAAVSAEAAVSFEEATRAREQGDLAAARAGFERAAALAPSSSHPLRRLCTVEAALGAGEQAVTKCRAARALEGSALNESALAVALTVRRGSGDLDEARRLALHANAVDPEEESAAVILAQIAMERNDMGALEGAVTALRRASPNGPFTHAAGAILAASKGEFDEAEALVDEARAAGISPKMADGLDATISDAKPAYADLFDVLQNALMTWLGVLALLIVGGFGLSYSVMRSAERLPRESTGRASGLDLALRRAYAALLWLASAFYYVSVPLVLGTVVLLAGGLVYGMLVVGHIPIKLIVIVVATAGYTLHAVVKSLFVRAKDEDPGVRVERGAHPRLDAVLDEVAERVGTRRVDGVFVTPGTDLAVFERGSLLARIRGASSERCLVLGVAALDGMALVDLKAILAHEYGHFRNEDTAGGGLALSVRRSLLLSAVAMAESGVAAWHNPAWQFVRGFWGLFLRISQGASRLQEILADRWAAHCYGAAAFERGLRHVITRSVAFDLQANVVLREVVAEKVPLMNLYRYQPKASVAEVELAKEVEDALDREASAYDSHPAPKDRFRLVRRLVGTSDAPDDGLRALDLFEDPDALEREMTARVRETLFAKKGVYIRCEEDGPG